MISLVNFAKHEGKNNTNSLQSLLENRRKGPYSNIFNVVKMALQPGKRKRHYQIEKTTDQHLSCI